MSSRPQATLRETRDVLRGLGAEGTVTELQIFQMIKSGPVRKLHRTRTGVADAITDALRRMQQSGQLEITSPVEKSRSPWSSWGTNQGSEARDVEQRARIWLTTRARDKQPLSVPLARQQYKKQHAKAGGDPRDLTEAIKDHLRTMALRAELHMDPKANRLLNLFSGGQSTQAPAAQSGLKVTHVDIEKEYRLGDGDAPEVVTTPRSTDLSEAPENRMLSWLAKREQYDMREVGVIAAGTPCHTWTKLDATLRKSGQSYRLGAKGTPNHRNPEKAAVAKEETSLAKEIVSTQLTWLFQGAYRGIQRHIWMESGASNKLAEQDFMEQMPPPQRTSYCMYKARMADDQLYPAQKHTSIWTTLKDWEPRTCNHQGDHSAVIGGPSQLRPKLKGMSIWASKRWTPEELIWDLLRQVRRDLRTSAEL